MDSWFQCFDSFPKQWGFAWQGTDIEPTHIFVVQSCSLVWFQQKAPQTKIHTDHQSEVREELWDKQVEKGPQKDELREEKHSKGIERKNREKEDGHQR